MSEDVLVVNNRLLQSHINSKINLLTSDEKDRLYELILGNHSFMARDLAEYNFEHKQIIPYVIIRCSDNYLLLQRTSKQTEKRLHDKFSLGIGGHINPLSSSTDKNVIVNGLYRELNEEVHLNSPADLTFIGIINDDSNSVSKVHMGLLYELQLESPDYEVLEKDKMTASWASMDRLTDIYPKLETWSQIVYDHYIKTGFEGSRVRGKSLFT